MVAEKMLPKMKVNKEKMKKAAEESYVNATDLADYLAEKGLPFREAHAIVGKIVKDAIAKGVYLKDIELADYKKYSELIEDDIYYYLDVKTSVERHNSAGGTSFAQVLAQIKIGHSLLEK
jgi:argininosuccinate lyase